MIKKHVLLNHSWQNKIKQHYDDVYGIKLSIKSYNQFYINGIGGKIYRWEYHKFNKPIVFVEMFNNIYLATRLVHDDLYFLTSNIDTYYVNHVDFIMWIKALGFAHKKINIESKPRIDAGYFVADGSLFPNKIQFYKYGSKKLYFMKNDNNVSLLLRNSVLMQRGTK